MAEHSEAMDLRDLWDLIWDAKWRVALCGGVCALIAVIYAFAATSWYRADVLLAPADTKTGQGLSGQLGGIGGLASLAGFNIGGLNPQITEAVAVLQSRDFARSFIEDQHLFELITANWARPGKALSLLSAPTAPDIRDVVKYFQENILFVQLDKKTNLVTMSIEWTDSSTAAEWANILVARLNDRMRQRALTEAETNTAYLQKELQTTNIVTIQQSIGHLLENEMQKLMIAKGFREYSFRVIDRAIPPKRRVRPKRTLLVAASFVIGSGLCILILIGRRALWRPHDISPPKLATSSDTAS